MTYTPPGPGSWALDAAHCERPHTRYTAEFAPDVYTRGFRKGFERYGILLDTIELQIVDGFAYMAIRPLGAPADAKRLPPKPVFWLLSRMHPALRRRIREAELVFAEKRWRVDVDQFFTVDRPRWRKRLRAYGKEQPAEMSMDALLDYLERGHNLITEVLYEHFSRGPIAFLPVGDFAVASAAWTGCDAGTAVAALTGSSPHSLDALVPMDRLIEAIRESEFSLEGAPEDVLSALKNADGDVGEAAATWLEEIGEKVFTGHNIGELRGVERPDVMVESLRRRMAAAKTSMEADTTAIDALRERVPSEHRAEFDALLEEARYAHKIRDGRGCIDYWAMGLVRRAVLEAGRRLVDAGRLQRADHVVDLTHSEICSALRGEDGPSADEVAAWFEARTSRSCADMPEILGPPPLDPPPPEWLPAAGARVARAMDWYLAAIFAPKSRENEATVDVEGVAASPGRVTARARVVTGPQDFGRIEHGDILVARITSNAYNILLPLLGGIVTERGGLLSHPAIVAREFGIPGIVGARGALAAIPDGATIEVDGERGTVRVLS